MFCALKELLTESDVEQKLLLPLLTSPSPTGFGYTSADVRTKLSIRRLEIGKGDERKLYFPDYMVLLAGLPALIVEAKRPGESLEEALREARLYANEVNALFPSGINPCSRVLACNGHSLSTSSVDVAKPDMQLAFDDITMGSSVYAALVERCCRDAFQKQIDSIRRHLRHPDWVRALKLVGGSATRAQELPTNTFGATIAGDYGHLFSPTTREDRAYVVKHAYVRSTERDRFVEPIDRIIRGGVPPAAASIPVIADTKKPDELTKQLRERRSLENQVLLLVGSAGSGKTTFIDHLVEVALPRDIVSKTVWLRLNINEAPVLKDLAYQWITTTLIEQLRQSRPDIDFDELESLLHLYRTELNALRKGALALLDPNSAEYKTRLADSITLLQADHIATAKALARWLCGEPGKLLAVTFDNCDKLDRDEQLLMFQVAQWVRVQFRCLVVVPIRDTTFDLYRNVPPLDTVLPSLRFRIEPPPFVEVLQDRVKLALKEMRAGEDRGDTLSFTTPNGIRVSYPVSEQGYYLACILRSLFAHDRFVRQVMSGLAGRDVRRALGMFLDFCVSGHIGEDEIYKIKAMEGRYELPLSVVARILLRMRRRYYDGDESYVKNLFQCDPQDALPDHFVRVAILRWLDNRRRDKGPSGALGFFRAQDLVVDLVTSGHEAERIRSELAYLARHKCIVAEHLRTDVIHDDDLVMVSSAGVVHLQLLVNADYVAACAEDAFISDRALAKRVAHRLTNDGVQGQFSCGAIAKTAGEFAEYLAGHYRERVANPCALLAQPPAAALEDVFADLRAAVAAATAYVHPRVFVGNLPQDAEAKTLREAFELAGLSVVDSYVPPGRGFGFVTLSDGGSAWKVLNGDVVVRVGGRVVRVDEASDDARNSDSGAQGGPERRREPARTARVCVRNLDVAVTESDLRSLFDGHGWPPLDLVVLRDPATGASRGFAFVTLESVRDAEAAIAALGGTRMAGGAITVSPATPRSPDPRRGKH